jgi:hypothetical protein
MRSVSRAGRDFAPVPAPVVTRVRRAGTPGILMRQ